MEVYDPRTNAWKEAAPMSTIRVGHEAAVLTVGGQEMLYVVGGYDTQSREKLASTEVYDPRTNAWKAGPSMSTWRKWFGMGLLTTGGQERLYVCGGQSGHSDNSNVEVYDPQTNAWTAAAPMIAGRKNPAAAVLTTGGQEMLYVMGGDSTNARVVVDSVEVYDPRTNVWTAVAPMPTKRHALETAVLTIGGQEMLYALGGAGGRSNPGSKASVEVYDPQTNRWTTVAPMSHVRTHLAAAVLTTSGKEKLYAIGGGKAVDGYDLNSMEVYD